MTLNTRTDGPAGASALILLHGAGSARQMWEPQLGALSERFRVVVPDLPGYGDSPGPFSLAAAVDGVVALLGDSGRVHLCGLSLGAMVALRVAATVPDRVRA